MVHLSNSKVIGAMIFYSILTFFVGPLVTRPFMDEHPWSYCLGWRVTCGMEDLWKPCLI